MAEYDHGFKIIARESGRALARRGGLNCRPWRPAESTLQVTTERLADRVFVARQGTEQFLVYMEFMTYWDRSSTWSLLGKSGMLAERDRLPVMTLVFVLRPRGYVRQNGTVQLSVGGRPTQQLWFQEICLWELEPEKWWEDEPGLMALYPLCHHDMEPEKSIEHAAHRIEVKESDGVKRADLLTTLGIFSRLAYPNIEPYKLIGREKMRESSFYQEILEEGAATGAVNARRVDILDLIEARFGKKEAAAFKKPLRAIEDPNKLRAIHRLAFQETDLAELYQSLKN